MKANNQVVLIYPRLRRGEKWEKAPPPLSLISLSGPLKSKGREVALYDLQHYEDYEALLRALPEPPICFGLSAMVSYQIRDGARFSEAARRIYPGIPVVWGGWFPTTLPDIAISHPDVDILVRGQGEQTFAELVDALSAGKSLSDIKGITYKKDGRILKNPGREPVDLNALPPLDYSIIDLSHSTLTDGHATYISSIGCPYNCKFCDVEIVFGKKWLALSAERVVEDIKKLVRDYHVRAVDFYDDNFFVNRERLRLILQGFIDKKLGIRWIANARVDQFQPLTEEDLKLISKSGCHTLTFGAESGNQKTLDYLQKGIKVEQIEEAARRLLHHDISVRYNFMVGIPGETPGDFQRTLQFILRLKKIHPRLGIVFYYYIPIPETRLAEDDIKMGFKPPDSFEGWSKNIIGDVTQPWSFRIDKTLMDDKRDTFKAMCYYFWKGYLLPGPRGAPLSRKMKGWIIKTVSRIRVRTGFYTLPVEWQRYHRHHE